MLPRPPADIAIESLSRDYPIEGGMIHSAILHGPQFYPRQAAGTPPRQALLIHPEGLGVNHTLLDRPARWLIARQLFDTILLPDRRGSGRSSVLTRPITPTESAHDLRKLLDRMAQTGDFDPAAPLAVIGVSYGGLVALALASIDPRVACVGLLAGSPQREPPGALLRLVIRLGLLDRLFDWQLRRSLGKRPRQDVNFDLAYDAAGPRQMSAHFEDAVYYLSPDRADSLRCEYTSTHDPSFARLPESLTLSLPIFQVTGEGDEQWVTQLPPAAAQRFPNLRRTTIPGALLHNDVYLQAETFVKALAEMMGEGGSY